MECATLLGFFAGDDGARNIIGQDHVEYIAINAQRRNVFFGFFNILQARLMNNFNTVLKTAQALARYLHFSDIHAFDLFRC